MEELTLTGVPAGDAFTDTISVSDNYAVSSAKDKLQTEVFISIVEPCRGVEEEAAASIALDKNGATALVHYLTTFFKLGEA